MKIIVGLGNPGKKYLHTRHNVGFKVIDKLAGKYKVKLKRAVRQKAWLAKLKSGGDLFLLVKPKTYMNNSGDCIKRVLAKHRSGREDLLVIYDDADLKLGFLRIRKSGSSAGHKGIASVMDAVGSCEVNRLKVGIGRFNSGGLTNYVLSDFSQEEKKQLREVLIKAGEVSLDWFKEKKEKTIELNLGGRSGA